MRLRRETRVGLIGLITVQLTLSALSIALLTRMGPAIQRILDENVYSAEAVEEMLSIIASAPPQGEAPPTFEAALERAQSNITEEGERPLLALIEARAAAAFAGDARARHAILGALQHIGQINRDSMANADARAKRLGQTGAWAAALLGALALGLAFIISRWLRLRLELPILALSGVMQRARAGDAQIRCHVSDGPREVQQLAHDLNWLLDALQRVDGGDGAPQAEDLAARRALAWVLSQDAAPRVFLDQEGRRVAGNAAGLAADLEAEGARWEATRIPGSTLTLYTQAPRRAAKHKRRSARRR